MRRSLILFSLGLLMLLVASSMSFGQCATCGTARVGVMVQGGGCGLGLLQRVHERRADRHAARANYHADRAACISSRRATVIVVQPAPKSPENLPPPKAPKK